MNEFVNTLSKNAKDFLLQSKKLASDNWKLWLDDQWNDPDTTNRWPPKDFIPALSSFEALELVKNLGLPSFLDLDHDLGGDDTAKVFLKELYELFPDGPVPGWRIHSANPQGGAWLNSFLDSWKRSLEFE